MSEGRVGSIPIRSGQSLEKVYEKCKPLILVDGDQDPGTYQITKVDDCEESHQNWRDYGANFCPTCGGKL